MALPYNIGAMVVKSLAVLWSTIVRARPKKMLQK